MNLELMPSVAKFIDTQRGTKSRAAWINATLRDLKNNPDILADLSATRERKHNDQRTAKERPKETKT